MKTWPQILVNATTIVRGGGVQGAVSFIDLVAQELPNEAVSRLRFAVSVAVARELERKKLDLIAVETFEFSPARWREGLPTRARLRELASGVDFVFTFFGPSYVRFSSPELMGFADPFVLFPANPAVARMEPVTRLKLQLKVMFKRWWLRGASAYLVETETAAKALAGFGATAGKPVYVVGNAVPTAFRAVVRPRGPALGATSVLVLAAPYPHKNLDLIPRVCRSLADAGRRDFRFRCTLPAPDFARVVGEPAAAMGVAEMVENLGVLRLDALTAAYAETDIVLHPSLLEVFSVTFLEAMSAGRPIVASDLPHAREICGAAAVYFRANDEADCARCLIATVDSPAEITRRVEAGRLQLKKFPDARQKFLQQCHVLSEFAKHVANMDAARCSWSQ